MAMFRVMRPRKARRLRASLRKALISEGISI